ncbi:MAG: response regulator transcription factor [Lachnospiraceae bacterium]|nr:response regulator transcription factor [Lachnospiraceae bacterium]
MAYDILVVEDDSQIREVISDFFTSKSEGDINVTTACDGNQGLERIYEKEYDLVMLDIMMPGADGFKICREIRKNSIVPVIFITARGREEDILYGYDMGCDDYIVKPFSLAELYAKANALLKRSKGFVVGKEISCGDISIDTVRFTVTVGGREIELPPKQYALLKYLIEHKEMVVEREVLLSRIWGYDFEGTDRVVDNHVKKLRNALGAAGKQIKTVVSKGYKIVE